MLEILESLKTTLCSISVSGEENLDHLLGCIQVVNKLIMAMKEGGSDENDHAE